jgi:hypothetical protein
VYADSGATTPLSNPVVADSGGLFPAIYLANTNAYKTVLQTSTGATVRTTDPISGGAGTSATFIPQGRLTLASGTPVMNANQASATSIIYTPYTGNQIPIYDGVSSFSALTFAELTNNTTQSSTGNAGPAAVTTNSNYDLFVWNNGGIATLTRGPAWTSDTARGTGAGTTQLQAVNGIQTNAVVITNGPGVNRGTYVGTVRSDGSSQINWIKGAVAANGTAAVLGVWNSYNRVMVRGFIGDTTATWNYSGGVWRAANASNTMRVSFVQGLQEDAFEAVYYGAAASGAGVAYTGVGLDTTSSVNFQNGTQGISQNGSNNVPAIATCEAQLLGFHFMQAVENNVSTAVTFDGNASVNLQTGMTYSGRL